VVALLEFQLGYSYNHIAIIPLASSVKSEDSLSLCRNMSYGWGKSIAQPKGHSPRLKFRYLSLTYVDFGDGLRVRRSSPWRTTA